MKNLILLGFVICFLASFAIFKTHKSSDPKAQPGIVNSGVIPPIQDQEYTKATMNQSKLVKPSTVALSDESDDVPDPDKLYELRLKPQDKTTEVPATIPAVDVMPYELAELESNYALNKTTQDYLDSQEIRTNVLTEGFPESPEFPASIEENQVIPYELELLENDFPEFGGDQGVKYQEPLWDDPISETMLESSKPEGDQESDSYEQPLWDDPVNQTMFDSS